MTFLALLGGVGCSGDAEPPIRVAGVRLPQIMAAEKAPLSDTEAVIGVAAGGRHRAYRLSAFLTLALRREGFDERTEASLGRQIVNDLLGKTTVTVTHCVRSGLTRVLTDPDSEEALSLALGGWDGDEMLLLIDGQRVRQDDADVSLKDLPFAVTTWRQWREAFPATDVYVGANEQRTEIAVEGIRGPRILSGNEALLQDETLVIGVIVNDRQRAYRLSAFVPTGVRTDRLDEKALSRLRQHVVNDSIDGTPVTVTHCDRSGCTRVLTDSSTNEPLHVGLGGWDQQQMLLLIAGQRLSQQSHDLLLSELPHVITTWREWREAFPQTDVYLGDHR